jgi:hypothetical protein
MRPRVAMGLLPLALVACELAFPLSDRFTKGYGDAATSDGAIPDGGPATPFCAGLNPKPMFCDDFDTVQPLESHWAQVDNGRALLDTTLFRSPPRALLSRLDGQTPDCSYAEASNSFHGDYRGFHASYALYFDPATFPGEHVVSAHFLERGSVSCAALLYLSDSTAKLVEQVQGGTNDGLSQHMGSVSVPQRRWARVDVDVDLAQARLKVTVDGAPSIDDALLRACPIPSGDAAIKLGFYNDCGSPPQTRQVSFDDVTFDAR